MRLSVIKMMCRHKLFLSFTSKSLLRVSNLLFHNGLFFKVDLITLSQCTGSAQAQENYDDQPKHKPRSADGTGQVERWRWCWDELGKNREEQHNEWYGREQNVPQRVKLLWALTPIEEWYRQADCHIDYQDEDGNDCSNERESRSRAIDKAK